MAENKYKKLAINSLIFSIANFGSKVLRFLIVPFYTYCMTTAEYGTVDTLVTTVSLVLPVVILAIHEASLRFAMKEEISNAAVLTNSFTVIGCSLILFLPIYFIFIQFDIFEGLFVPFYLLIIFEGVNSILLNFTRGIGKSFIFALAGIINTAVLLVSNVILLAVFDYGIKGYIISMILGYFVSSIVMVVAIRANQYIVFKTINRRLIKDMLRYSIPLIPVAVMWWVMNASDRYVITWFLGISATGVYAVAHKIPTIITMIYQIFQQAWQISAIEEKNSDKNDEFYSNVYNAFVSVLFIASSAIILIIKPLLFFAVSESFFEAWKYTPLLVVGAVFSSFAGFLGVNYAVSEKTIGAMTTSIISAACNFILNIIFTPIWGMYGTAIATLIGFYVLWVVRMQHTKKFYNIKQDLKNIHIQFILVLVQSYFLIKEFPCQYLLQAAFFVGILLLNQKELQLAVGLGKKMIELRRNRK